MNGDLRAVVPTNDVLQTLNEERKAEQRGARRWMKALIYFVRSEDRGEWMAHDHDPTGYHGIPA